MSPAIGRGEVVTPNPIPLRCKQCAGSWTHTIVLPLEMRDFVGRLKAITRLGCPHCGANGLSVLLGHAIGEG